MPNVPVLYEYWYAVILNTIEYNIRYLLPAPFSLPFVVRAPSGDRASSEIRRLFERAFLSPDGLLRDPRGGGLYRIFSITTILLPDDIAKLYEVQFQMTGIKMWTGKEQIGHPPIMEDGGNLGNLVSFPRNGRAGWHPKNDPKKPLPKKPDPKKPDKDK